jgi:PAS domain S-box-containing protein
MAAVRTHTVLNVNDDEARRYLIGHALRRAGYRVVDAETGREALARAGAAGPDLILLDVRLPDIDGFEVCRRLKATVATATIPVVMVSEIFTDDVDRIEALELGADGYLTDPRPPVTLATIRAVLRAREAEEGRRQSEAQYRALFDSMPVPAWVLDLDSLQVLAVNDAAVRDLGHSREAFLAMTIEAFGPPEDMPALREALTRPASGKGAAGVWQLRRRDGRLIDAEITTARVTYEGREVRLILAHDVTERRRADALQRTQLAVARVLTASHGVEQAGPLLLEAMCRGLGWDVGELWSETAGGSLRLDACWEREAFRGFETASRAAVLVRGTGVAGRVWATGQAQWIPDVAAAPDFSRRTAAVAAGLHAAAAFPVHSAGRPTGVMAFFSGRVQAFDPHVLGMMSDLGGRIGLVLERQRAEDGLRAAEARYRLALKAMHGVVWDWDVARDTLIVSDALEALFGHPARQRDRAWWIGQMHRDDRERVVQHLDATLASDAEEWTDEYRFRRADGTYARVTAHAYILRDGGGAPARVIGAVTDVTERRLREDRDRLRALSLGMLDAREDEARRIARELHDEAGQLLGSAHLVLDELAERLPVELQARIGVVRARLDEAQGRVRQLAHELRPPVLDDLGLVAALELLAETTGFRSRLAVDVVATLEGRLPSAIETTLYRVVQEALANAARHAAATHVTVELEGGGDTVRCRIRDDGAGFDAAGPPAGGRGRGLGMISMRERVEALGGRLHVVSRPGHGTEIRAEIPLGVGDGAGAAHPAG